MTPVFDRHLRHALPTAVSGRGAIFGVAVAADCTTRVPFVVAENRLAEIVRRLREAVDAAIATV